MTVEFVLPFSYARHHLYAALKCFWFAIKSFVF